MYDISSSYDILNVISNKMIFWFFQKDKEGKNTMSEYITTYTGKYFNPTQPNPDLISIQDIAHAPFSDLQRKWSCTRPSGQ